MTQALFTIDPLLPPLEAGQVVLTPNNRLRNQMRLAYGQACQTPVVATPAIYTLSEWLDTLWQRLQSQGYPASQRVLLNDLQASELWREVVEASDFVAVGMPVTQLVRQLKEAFRAITLWAIPLADIAPSGWRENLPEGLLLDWLEAYQQRLDHHQALTSEQRQPIIAQAFEDGLLTPLPQLWLQSFDDIAPVTQQLLNVASPQLASAPEQPQSPELCVRTAYADLQQELYSAARWSWQQLQTNPQARIGIVVPSLGQERQRVERIFSEVFEPQQLAPDNPRYAVPFNISAGTPLASAPLIHHSLLLLELNRHQLTRQQWLTLLSSPFFADEPAERLVRCELQRRIKQTPKLEISGTQVREWLQQLCDKHPHQAFQALSQQLQQLASNSRQQPAQTSAAQWIERWLQQLALLGWPGRRPLDSVEYQQLNQWYQLMEQLASYDWLAQPLSFNQAHGLLTQLATNTHFQAEIRQTPITILGTLEAAGLHFSHCWITGLNNREWPPKPEPNSLLPMALQRRYQLPRCSAEREMGYAQAITQHLLRSAPVIIASYSNQFEETQQLPSSLIEHLPEVPGDQLVDATPTLLQQFQQTLSQQQTLEWVDCQQGPPLYLGDANNATTNYAKGGTDILKQQASSPFDAFAIHRLGARDPETPALGLTAQDKGKLLHQVLESLWHDLGDQTSLAALTDQQLTDQVTGAVNSALTFHYKRDIQLLGDYYYGLEAQRLIQLISEWLELEKTQRSPFTVLARETELRVNLAGLPLTLRIDRVDQLADGRLLLIDYKSRAMSNASFLGERPSEPQLPLYGIGYQPTPDGLAFATVAADQLAFTGLGDLADNTVPGVKPVDAKIAADWPELLHVFEQRLNSLAAEYLSGHCPVFERKNDGGFQDYLKPLNRSNEFHYLQFRRSQAP